MKLDGAIGKNSLHWHHRGSVLLLVLVMVAILSSVSLLLLKHTILQQKLLLNLQATSISFQAAESAINSVLGIVSPKVPSQVKRQAWLARVEERGSLSQCLGTQGLIEGQCVQFDDKGDYNLNRRLQVEVTSRFIGSFPATGYSAARFSYRHFSTAAKAVYSDQIRIPVSQTHVQNWKWLSGRENFSF